MFYRRKIILALLQAFNGELDKIRLQKLLFLFTQTEINPTNKVYDFVPYRFGCYSYSANADITAMVTRGIVMETATSIISIDKTDYLKLLKENDRKQLLQLKSVYGRLNVSQLMKYTYVNYPYWALKSEKAESILSVTELQKVKTSVPVNDKTILYTIGYEGISLEEYLNRLIKNDVKILADVRNNPLSMKYGFNKNQLKRYCESLGIHYIHFPEVGIKSEQRQELNSQNDYDELFAKYRTNNLQNTINTQKDILTLLKQHKRLALTCFEANICQCHRKHLAEAIAALPGFAFEVMHI